MNLEQKEFRDYVKKRTTESSNFASGLNRGFELAVEFSTWLENDPFKNDENFKNCKPEQFSKEFLLMKFLSSRK